VRVQYIRQQLCSYHKLNSNFLHPLSGFTVADVGCGGGLLSECIACLGGKVTGVDAGEESIKVAQLHATQNPRLSANVPKYFCSTVEELVKSERENFDVVCSLEVVEHVQDVPQFISSLCHLVK